MDSRPLAAPIAIVFGLVWHSRDHEPKTTKNHEPIINTKMYDRIFFTGLFKAAMGLYLFQIGKIIYSYS
jgi:hypothetical protein